MEFRKNAIRFAHVPFDFISFYLLDQKKEYDVRFEYVHGTISDFVSFPVFGFILIIKVINFDFESY